MRAEGAMPAMPRRGCARRGRLDGGDDGPRRREARVPGLRKIELAVSRAAVVARGAACGVRVGDRRRVVVGLRRRVGSSERACMLAPYRPLAAILPRTSPCASSALAVRVCIAVG